MQLFRLSIWKLGIKSLTLHPMRSALTVLGIFIGIASVVWLLAIGEGISKKVQEQIEELGTNNIIVRSVKPVSENTSDSSSMAIYGVTRMTMTRFGKPSTRLTRPSRSVMPAGNYITVNMTAMCILSAAHRNTIRS